MILVFTGLVRLNILSFIARFNISAIEGENIYYVTGVCDKGSIIIGSLFSEVYQYIRGKDSKGLPLTKGKEFVRNIRLQVKQIRAYRRSLEELPKGMSGELWLAGFGEVHLQPRESLVGQNQSCNISAIAFVGWAKN